MNKFVFLIPVLMSLSACLSPEEQKAADLAEDQRTCLAYGFTKATPAFADCMIKIGDRRTLSDIQRRQAMSRLGAQMLNGQPAY